MLYLDTSLELEGVTLFRDYNAPNRYYYMPRSPRLSVEAGQPMFQLLIYRRDITDNPDFRAGDRPGGGFLTMTVDIGVPQATLTSIKTQLASRGGGNAEIDLAPVPFERGSVRVSALGASAGTAPALEGGGGEEGAPPAENRTPRFVEKIMGSSRPSLYGDNRCVFSIEMSHEGAQLMRASLQDGGASQVAVIYDLEYRGLNPAYEAKITINFRQSYSYLRTRFTLNTLWFRSDIDAESERLVKEGHIKIEDVDYLGLDPAKAAERAEKLTQLAKELATWSFVQFAAPEKHSRWNVLVLEGNETVSAERLPPAWEIGPARAYIQRVLRLRFADLRGGCHNAGHCRGCRPHGQATVSQLVSD